MNNEQNKLKLENKQFNKQTNKQQTTNSLIFKPFLMKKIFVFAAIAASVLAVGCAKNEVIQNVTKLGDAVQFGVYAGKTATKTAPVSAAYYGNITTTELKLATAGFGVFGYYTGNANYANSTAANFMYNEKVTWNSTAWEYSPVKYWPNEHGATAVSSDEDKLTFLCYAPYVANLAINGNSNSTVSDGAGTPAAATQGITAMTGNTMAEDAKITFSVPSSKDEQIDLLYGVLKTQSVNVDGTNEGTVGNPIENLTKQKTGGKVDILFKHALAKAQIDICDVIDQVAPTSSVNPTTTKVVVKNLNILGVDSEGNRFGTAGILNLYTGAWSSVTGTASFAITPLPACISVASAPTTWASLSSIEGVLEGGLTAAGYAAAPGKFEIMFVPGGKIRGVEIIYYVVTQDAKLDGGVSVVENHITKEFDTDGGTPGNQPIVTAKGKQYNINIQLGLTSVKLQADVEDWDDDDYPIDLPQNVTA